MISNEKEKELLEIFNSGNFNKFYNFINNDKEIQQELQIIKKIEEEISCPLCKGNLIDISQLNEYQFLCENCGNIYEPTKEEINKIINNK